MEILYIFIRDLYNVSRLKFLLNLLLMVVIGMMEGIGILMIIPLLIVAGIIPGIQASGDWALWLEQFINITGITLSLPLVLVLYTAINFAQSWLQRCQAILSFDIQQTFGVSLSIRLFRAVAYAKWQLIMSKPVSDITNVLISELMRVYSGMYLCLNMAATALITTIQILLAFIIAPDLTCSVLVGAFFLFLCLRTFFKDSRRIGQETSNLNSDLLHDLTEHLAGIKDIKSHGLEPVQIQSFINTRTLIKNNLRKFTKLQTRADMFNKVGAAVFISLFLFSAIEVFKLSVQQLVLVSVISSRLWPKLASLQMGFLNLHTTLPAFRNAYDLENQCLAAQEDITEGEASGSMGLERGIEFRKVSFYYNQAPMNYAVVNANFMLHAGTTTAFVGVSGSGKSTLVDLLIGLLTPVMGNIFVDDKPLVHNLRAWRKSIGYVPQDPFLLNASIRDNLLWASPDASEDEMREALRLAAIDTFVDSLPETLDTIVGDRGVRLSGGERQRIVLARALLRKPSVLILDEATSSLDSENERRIQQAMENLQGKMTIVVIAHRISTIRNADRIFVLEQGQIVEQGNYRTLINNKAGRFYALAWSYAK